MDKNEVLKQYFGHSEFRPGQGDIIDHILAGQDCLGVMPTGAGKSVCFQVPALMFSGTSIVISPLISLMKDQVEGLRQSGVNAAFINSSLDLWEYRQVLDNASSGLYKILYVAPERLTADGFLSMCRGLDIPLVAVDEAHCVSHWGQDFRPSYLKISEFVEQLPKRPVLAAFTATATDIVKDDIVRILGLRQPFSVTTGFDRPNLYFEVRPTEQRNKNAVLLGIIREMQGRSSIVYCSTRKNVEAVTDFLRLNGVNVRSYHAGMPDDERRSAQEDFTYDRCNVIVATNAFGMGIDKSDVALVVHYNMPKDLESYYQEAGRAGRDGSPARCILLYSKGDVRTAEFIIDHGREESGLTPAECGKCSSCNAEMDTLDITVEAQKVISCVYRLKQRGRSGGKVLVSGILCGSESEQIKEGSYDTLSTYGIMKDVRQTYVREIIDHLELQGLLSVSDDYHTLEITPEGDEFIRSRRTLLMKRSKRAADISAVTQFSNSDGVEDPELMKRLRELRKKFADTLGVPAFVVFSDASLRDMCAKKPATKQEFLCISGVGSVKAERYGKDFVRVVSEYLNEKNS